MQSLGWIFYAYVCSGFITTQLTRGIDMPRELTLTWNDTAYKKIDRPRELTLKVKFLPPFHWGILLGEIICSLWELNFYLRGSPIFEKFQILGRQIPVCKSCFLLQIKNIFSGPSCSKLTMSLVNVSLKR